MQDAKKPLIQRFFCMFKDEKTLEQKYPPETCVELDSLCNDERTDGARFAKQPAADAGTADAIHTRCRAPQNTETPDMNDQEDRSPVMTM